MLVFFLSSTARSTLVMQLLAQSLDASFMKSKLGGIAHHVSTGPKTRPVEAEGRWFFPLSQSGSLYNIGDAVIICDLELECQMCDLCVCFAQCIVILRTLSSCELT